MMYALGDKRPILEDAECWIAPNATLVGDVTLGRGVTVWWNAVLRGDNEPITIGDNCNIQDGCVLHADPGFALTLGAGVSVGHMSMLHGCRIGAGSLIGIGSIVLNGAAIGENCLIGANTLVGEGKEIPDNSLVLGSPGRVVRDVTEKQKAMLAYIAENYVARGLRYRNELQPLG